MSEVIVQPSAPFGITVTQTTPATVTIADPVVFPITVNTSGNFTTPPGYLGVSAIVGTANQITATTVGNIATLTIPNLFVTPDDARILGDFRVDGLSTINGTMTVTAGTSLIADVGGDLQGTLPNPTVHRIKNIDIHNNPADGDLFQYQSGNNKYHWVTLAEAGIAAASHTHSGAAITSGTVGIAYLPTGTSASTVALGNHTHDASAITTGTIAIARIPTGTSGTTVALGNHTHSGADITSGTVGISYLPTGTSASTVALGNHTHSAADITSGTLDIARIPSHTHSIDDITDFRESKIYVESECNSAGEFTTIALNSPSNLFTTTSLDAVAHYGILNSGTGASNNAVGGIGSAQETDMIAFGSHKHSTTAIINIPTLSTGTERFIIEHGFSDNRSATPTDGAFIQYSDNINGGRWFGVVYNNTTASTVDLNITVAANTWYKLRTVVNADRSVDFYVDDVLKGSLAAGTAPLGTTSTSRRCGLHCTIRKTVGTTTRNLYTDYINLQIDTAR